MTLTELKARLQEIEEAIDECIKTGKSYSISGSHSVQNHSLEELEKEAARIRRRIYRYMGYSSRVKPDFS